MTTSTVYWSPVSNNLWNTGLVLFHCPMYSICPTVIGLLSSHKYLLRRNSEQRWLFFEKFVKNFLVREFFVIGVKPGRCIRMREDGKAVKMEFWAMEKEQEELQIFTSLPVLNCLLRPALVTSRKAQDEKEDLPMHRNTTKPKVPGDITNARRAPVRQKASISDMTKMIGIRGIHSILPAQGPF